jgi:hypothetical protein
MVYITRPCGIVDFMFKFVIIKPKGLAIFPDTDMESRKTSDGPSGFSSLLVERC